MGTVRARQIFRRSVRARQIFRRSVRERQIFRSARAIQILSVRAI